MYLLDFIKSLVPHISKNEVLEDVRVTKKELEATTIPSANQAAEFYSSNKIKSKATQALADVFYRNYNIGRSRNASNLATDIDKALPVVLETLGFIEKRIDTGFGPDILSEGINADKAITLRAVEQISFISRFTMDLLAVMCMNEAVEANVELLDALQLPKVTVNKVEAGMALYARILSIYGDSATKLEKILVDVPDVIINDKTEKFISTVYNGTKLDPINTPLLSKFDGSPIYHIRMVIAEWQASRYNAMKDKKKMLELRLMHLKLLEEKKDSPALEKEISYIQSRIDKIEYSMAKMEGE